MRGSFRRDAELLHDPAHPGAFEPVRSHGARNFSRLLIALSLAAVGLDLWTRHLYVAIAQLLLSLGFLLVHVLAEARSWRFASDEVVLRHLALPALRLREEKLRAQEIARVGLARRGSRARAWLELKSGLRYALVEGRAEQVERIAGAVQSAVLLAQVEPKGQTLH